MPRTCTVCAHQDREAIDKALVTGTPFRDIALRFSVSTMAAYRHGLQHLPLSLIQAEENRETVRSLNVMEELQQCIQRVNLLSDACDAYLRDPEDPSRYFVGPRAEDVSVVYTEPNAEGKEVRKKAPLSELLAKVEGQGGRVVQMVETKHADPRELLLKAYDRLQGRLELCAKLMGELQQEGTVNIIVSPEWLQIRAVIIQALAPYPEARIAAAAALSEVEE
jgi:hypothetical protein